MMVWKMFLLFQGCILRFHVNLSGCIFFMGLRDFNKTARKLNLFSSCFSMFSQMFLDASTWCWKTSTWIGCRVQSSIFFFEVVRSQQNLLKSETQVMLLTQRPQQLVAIVVDQKRQRFIEQEWAFFLEADPCWMLAVPKLWSGIWSMPFPSTQRYSSYSIKA